MDMKSVEADADAVVVEDDSDTATNRGPNAPTMRKPELIDRVVLRSGVKKRDAKPAIEAALAVLGEALSEGEVLQLPPLGKLRVTRTVEQDEGEVLVCKLRRRAAG
ncbi:MAG: HU family DNA-binding protein [Pseudomonadota bacterium]